MASLKSKRNFKTFGKCHVCLLFTKFLRIFPLWKFFLQFKRQIFERNSMNVWLLWSNIYTLYFETDFQRKIKIIWSTALKMNIKPIHCMLVWFAYKNKHIRRLMIHLNDTNPCIILQYFKIRWIWYISHIMCQVVHTYVHTYVQT